MGKGEIRGGGGIPRRQTRNRQRNSRPTGRQRHIGRNVYARAYGHNERGHIQSADVQSTGAPSVVKLKHILRILLFIVVFGVCLPGVIVIAASDTVIGSCLLVGGVIMIVAGCVYFCVKKKCNTCSSSFTVTQISHRPGDDVNMNIYHTPSTTIGTENQPSINSTYSSDSTGTEISESQSASSQQHEPSAPPLYESTGTEISGNNYESQLVSSQQHEPSSPPLYESMGTEISGNNYDSQPASSQRHEPSAPPLYESCDHSQPVPYSDPPPSYDQAVHMQTP